MTHAPHKARRIRHSAIPPARLPARSMARKDFQLGALVVGTLALIVIVYAATMRYQRAYKLTVEDFPRWSALTDGIVDRTAPVRTQIQVLKAAVVAVSDAKKTQMAAAELLKRKIETRAAATETPETP